MAGIRINPEGQNQQQFSDSRPPLTVPQNNSIQQPTENIPKQEQTQQSTKESTTTKTMSETEQRDRSPDVDDDDKEIKLTPRKVYKFDDPPIIFRDVDVSFLDISLLNLEFKTCFLHF